MKRSESLNVYIKHIPAVVRAEMLHFSIQAYRKFGKTFAGLYDAQKSFIFLKKNT